jgi:hypothetical protein
MVVRSLDVSPVPPSAALPRAPSDETVRTAAELRALYRAGEISEAELEWHLERLAEREGLDALTLAEPAGDRTGVQAVERGFSQWFGVALLFVTVAVALPVGGVGPAVLTGAAAVCVAAGIYSIAAYSYRRGSLPRASAP